MFRKPARWQRLDTPLLLTHSHNTYRLSPRCSNRKPKLNTIYTYQKRGQARCALRRTSHACNDVQAGKTSVFEARDDHARDQMEHMEWKCGPAVLSSSYIKVGSLVQHCQTAVSAGQGIVLYEALSFLLHIIDYVVSTEQVRPATRFTMVEVGKQRDGSQGWLGVVLHKLTYMRHFDKMCVCGSTDKGFRSCVDNSEHICNAVVLRAPEGHPAGCRGRGWRGHGKACPSGTTRVRPTPNALQWQFGCMCPACPIGTTHARNMCIMR